MDRHRLPGVLHWRAPAACAGRAWVRLSEQRPDRHVPGRLRSDVRGRLARHLELTRRPVLLWFDGVRDLHAPSLTPEPDRVDLHVPVRRVRLSALASLLREGVAALAHLA